MRDMARAKAPARRTRSRTASPAGDAAAILLREVGAPDNINRVAIDRLRCVVAWAAADEPTRIRVVDELTAALWRLATSPVFGEIQSSAWNADPAFVVMIAVGKAIDRLIRARLPLGEPTLRALAEIAAVRAEYSAKRLATQLEAFAAHAAISPALDLAILALADRYAWDDALAARLRALVPPVVDAAAARTDATERALIAAIARGDRASRAVYADWLETRGDHRGAAFLRADDPPRSPARAAVAPAWCARLGLAVSR